jgi:ariadne-1
MVTSEEEEEVESEGYCSDYQYEWSDEFSEAEKRQSVARLSSTESITSTNEELGSQQSNTVCSCCQREAHDPVQDCRTIAAWLARRQELFTLPPQAVHACAQRLIRETARRCQVDEDQAGTLCRSYDWDLDRIAREYRRNQLKPEYRRNQLKPKTKPPPTDATGTCLICYTDDLTASDMMSLECQHFFCRVCWRSYIQNQLSDGLGGGKLEITCPATDCHHVVTDLRIQQVAADLYPRFQRLQLETFVQSHGMGRCPGPDCGWIAVPPRLGLFEDVSSGYLCGNCHTAFRFERTPRQLLDLGSHTAFRFERTPRQLLDLGNPLIKKCPNCSVDIEKTGGCNHMFCTSKIDLFWFRWIVWPTVYLRCTNACHVLFTPTAGTQCSHHFCWLCLTVYSGGGHYCGNKARATDRPSLTERLLRDVDLRYVLETINQDDTNIPLGFDAVLQQIKQLEHYAHFYNRYYAHGQGQRFCEQQCECLDCREEEYTRWTDIKSASDTDFIRLANKTLVASRRLLKYTYCLAYYHDVQRQEEHPDDERNDSKRSSDNGMTAAHLGFIQLERLEGFTENLSEASENARTRQDQTYVINLVRMGLCVMVRFRSSHGCVSPLCVRVACNYFQISCVTKSMEAVADFESFHLTSPSILSVSARASRLLPGPRLNCTAACDWGFV